MIHVISELSHMPFLYIKHLRRFISVITIGIRAVEDLAQPSVAFSLHFEQVRSLSPIKCLLVTISYFVAHMRDNSKFQKCSINPSNVGDLYLPRSDSIINVKHTLVSVNCEPRKTEEEQAKQVPSCGENGIGQTTLGNASGGKWEGSDMTGFLLRRRTSHNDSQQCYIYAMEIVGYSCVGASLTCAFCRYTVLR